MSQAGANGVLVNSESAQYHLPSTTWVKGELLHDLSPTIADPRKDLTRSTGTILFDRLEWFARVHAQLGKGEPVVGRAWNQGLRLWLFLNLAKDGTATALGNWYSMAFRPVFCGEGSEAQKHQLLFALAKRLARAKRSPSRITLSPVPRIDGSSNLITSAFRKAGWFVQRRQSSTSWTANVAGVCFDDYWAARPSQLRNTYQRKLKNSTITAEILTRFDEAAWSAYENVYADSWKPREGSMDFLRDLAKAESNAGCVRLGLAKLDGEVVAAQFWTVDNGRAYIHKLAYRESAKAHSPGTILSVAMFKHVIDNDHVDVIDYGTGNDAYKAAWMDSVAPLDTIMLFNRRKLRGLIYAACETLTSLVHKPGPPQAKSRKEKC